MPEFAYPVNELIAQAFLTALTKLTQAPSISGQNTQLSGVERSNPPFNQPAQMKAVLIDGDEEALETDANTPLGHTAWRAWYAVLVYVLTSETDTTFAQKVNIVRGDVSKIIMAEIKNSTNLGGNCQNIWDRGAQRLHDASEITGVIVHFQVEYWTDQYDPYQAG